jgi:hypothetical protein
MAGMAGPTGIQHGADRRVPGEEFRDGSGVLAVPLHPQRQRLQPADGQVDVERAGHRPGPVLQETERGVELLVVGD